MVEMRDSEGGVLAVEAWIAVVLIDAFSKWEREGDENGGDEDGGVSGEGFLVLLGFMAARRDKVRESEREGEG